MCYIENRGDTVKTATKITIAIVSLIIWIAGLFVFVPYNLKTVICEDDFPAKYFNIDNNYLIDDIMEINFENSQKIISDLKQKSYTCLSEEETYNFLMKISSEKLNGYNKINGLLSAFSIMDVKFIIFFEYDNSAYILFELQQEEKAPFRLLPSSYVIFRTDSFCKELSDQFFESSEMISSPAEMAAFEAIIQSCIVTAICAAIIIAIALIFSTKRYKKEKEKEKFTNDDTTSSYDIKKFIRKSFGDELFSAEKLDEIPCITIEANYQNAAEFICKLADKYEENEIFIGSFFEESNYIDIESDIATYIKEYLDEGDYSSILHPENDIVIEWIAEGNNADVSSVAFYMQNLNVLIYPIRNKVYIFCKNPNDTFMKLIDIANELKLSVSANN